MRKLEVILEESGAKERNDTDGEETWKHSHIPEPGSSFITGHPEAALLGSAGPSSSDTCSGSDECGVCRNHCGGI